MHQSIQSSRSSRLKPRAVALALLIASLCLVDAEAFQVTGDISFGGSVKFNGRSLARATGVTQWKGVLVTSDSGDFAAFAAPGSPVAVVTPWAFSSSTPFSGLWSVNGFTFDLTSSAVLLRSKKSLSLEGTGTVSGNGFDATVGDWTFTYAKARKHTGFNFNFEADPLPSSPSPSPGPSSSPPTSGPFPTPPIGPIPPISPPSGQPPGASVPETGSTFVLLCLAFVGLYWFRLTHEQRLAVKSRACDRKSDTELPR